MAELYLSVRHQVRKPDKPLKNWPKIKKVAGARGASTRMGQNFVKGLFK